MFALKVNNIKYFCCLVFTCLVNARQIRYSRYNTEVIGDIVENKSNTFISAEHFEDNENEYNATVREIKLTPYPASGFKPSVPFLLPNEIVSGSKQDGIDEQVTDELQITSTFKTFDFTMITEENESETTTTARTNNIEKDNINKNANEGEDNVKYVRASVKKTRAPYSPAGIQPKIPLLFPTHVSFNNGKQKIRNEKITNPPKVTNTRLSSKTEFKVPYTSEQIQLQDENSGNVNTQNVNSNHPVCGSSTNPLAPKPLNSEKADPDSESININTKP